MDGAMAPFERELGSTDIAIPDMSTALERIAAFWLTETGDRVIRPSPVS